MQALRDGADGERGVSDLRDGRVLPKPLLHGLRGQHGRSRGVQLACGRVRRLFLCSVSEMAYQLDRCGGVVGMYFLVKKCSLLFLFAGNGTFGLSPYLDVHGEVDMSMRYVCIDCRALPLP